MDAGTRSVDRWLSRLSATSSKNAEGYLTRWLQWLNVHGGQFRGYTPDQLVDYQLNVDNESRFDVLDAVQRYTSTMNGRVSTKATVYSYLRSFFLHNRAGLPRDPSYKIRSDVPKVRGKLTAENVRDVVLSSNPCHQAIFLCMFQAALGLDEFSYWNQHGWESLKIGLKGDTEVIKIELPGRKRMKNERPYYTFIGGDAITAIRKWLPHRPDNATAIFTSIRGKPLSKPGLQIYWLRHLRKLGFVGPPTTGDTGHRTGMNPHELRNVFRSQWSKSPAKYEVGEYFMGHVVDPFEYDKSFRDVDFYRREYRKALPFLQIMSSGIPYGRVEQSEVEKLQDEVSALKTQLAEVRTARRESDTVMDQLFEDDEFRAILRRKLNEMT